MAKKSRRRRPGRPQKNQHKQIGAGTHVCWPGGAEQRYGISKVLRWRWERDGVLPPRDFVINGDPAGWFVSTLDAWDRERFTRSA